MFRYLWSWENRYFGRWLNQAVFFFFVDVCRYRVFGDTVECFELFVVQSTEIGLNKSRHRGRATKRHFFFLCVSDEADGYFVSSPLEWVFEVLLGKIFGNRCLEIIKICAGFWWSHWMCSEIHELGFRSVFEGQILLAELIKVWVV